VSAITKGDCAVSRATLPKLTQRLSRIPAGVLLCELPTTHPRIPRRIITAAIRYLAPEAGTARPYAIEIRRRAAAIPG
jgi:hypothetical protein